MWISISEASRNWGVSRTTIHAKIKQKLLSKNENGLLDPSEMSRVFGKPKTKPNNLNTLYNTDQWTALNSQIWLLEQALQFEQQRNQDLQHRLNEANERIHTQEKHIFQLLETIKDLSQGIKRLEAPQTDTSPQNQSQRKKFLGIF